METNITYQELLESKKVKPKLSGFIIEPGRLHNDLFPFQEYIVTRALAAGRFAIFADCGLGKTFMQLQWAKIVSEETGKPVLILTHLAVSKQTINEANKFGMYVDKYGRLQEERPYRIDIDNYEQLDNIDVSQYSGIVLDESSILKNFTGATKRKLLIAFKNTPYKLACTATPAPNDLNEIGNHSEFLDILDAQDMRSKWFVRDEGMNNYRLKGHAKKSFYSWVSSWAVMLTDPADIGFPMPGYQLPGLNFVEREIKTDKKEDGKLYNEGHVNATNFNREVRVTQTKRLEEVADIVNNSSAQFIIWVKHNDEGEKLKKIIPGAVEVAGKHTDKFKEDAFLDFAESKFRVLITKMKIASFGLNFQACHNMVFTAPDFSFESIYQAIRRCYRFGQKFAVNVYMMVTDTMENVAKIFQRKQKQFKEMQQEMNQNINSESYGLKETYEFKEFKAEGLWLMKGDSCIEIDRVPDKSVRLIIFSPPFSSLFTYSNYIHDMGNNVDHEAFFKQYGHLLPKLYNKLIDGGIMVCHTKDLGVYKNSSGYTGMYDFTKEHTTAVETAGFKLHCKITIWTDPVLEMQRTKTQRLLYKTLTTDSSYTGVGMAEYLTVFRKWDGDESAWSPINHITRQNFPLDQWQEWASPAYKEKLLNYSKEDLVAAILQMKAETFRLKFGCNPGLPDGWYDDVWFDIKRTDVLNSKNADEVGDEKHIALLQLEVIKRCVMMWSNPGDKVLTPFLGAGSEAYETLECGREAIGIELKDSYFDEAVKNCMSVISRKKQMVLF